MDEDQLLDYEEEQDETADGKQAENGSGGDKKIKVVKQFMQLSYFYMSTVRMLLGLIDLEEFTHKLSAHLSYS